MVYNLKKMYMVLTKINTSVYRDFCWHEYNYLIHFNFLYKTFRQKKKKKYKQKKGTTDRKFDEESVP